MPNPGRTSLYRLYRGDNVLLYVGIATDPEARCKYHQRTKPWWGDVGRRAVQWYETRVEAAQAEAIAVRDEHPLHNLAQPIEDGSSSFRLINPKPKRLTPSNPIRGISIADDVWRPFGRCAKQAYTSRTVLIYEFMRWYMRRPGAKLPERPPAGPWSEVAKDHNAPTVRSIKDKPES